DLQSAFGEGLKVQRAAMSLDNRGNDRQPHAGAVLRSGSLGANTLERLGEMADLSGVKDRTAVLNNEQRVFVLDGGPNANPAICLVVADAIVDHVLDHSGEQRLAAGDP